jgi:predicted ATP-dependent endonuclease of OLD family
MFNIDNLHEEDNFELMVEQDGVTTEVMLAGAAFRKVFVALVLLFTLAEKPEAQRVFLIEEPESMLYPVLQRVFIQTLLDLCKIHRIQLLATSNSDSISQFFSPVRPSHQVSFQLNSL